MLQSPGSEGIPFRVPGPPQMLNDGWPVWVRIEVEENLRMIRVSERSKLNSVRANIRFLHQMESDIDHAFLVLGQDAAWMVQHKHNV